MGSAFIDFFDITAGAIFVDHFGALMSSMGSPDWLVTIVAGGIGQGIQTVATFIPVIAALFLALSVLESSGYMSRAAFVVDGLMRRIGLPGKSFVPMIVGFGCSVPAIMATRTLILNMNIKYMTNKKIGTPAIGCNITLSCLLYTSPSPRDS